MHLIAKTQQHAKPCQLLLAFAWSLRGRLKGCALDRTTRRTEKELSSKPRFEHRQLESLTSCPAPRICSRKAFLNRFNSLFSDVCQAISLAVLLSDVELCPRQACCFTRRAPETMLHRASYTGLRPLTKCRLNLLISYAAWRQPIHPQDDAKTG